MNARKDDQIQVSNEITVREAGTRGGNVTRDRYAGTDFYRRIGAKGGTRTKELYRDLLSEFGKKGGRPKRPTLSESAGERDHQQKEATCGRPTGLTPPPEL